LEGSRIAPVPSESATAQMTAKNRRTGFSFTAAP
jgi:hypothetical protein